MPVVYLRHKPYKEELKKIAEELAPLLPFIVAPALTLPDRESLDGFVTPDDITVRLDEGNEKDVNAQDLEIMIFAHDFPERRENLEERKDAVLRMIRIWLANRNYQVSGFVWILLEHTAFGKL